MKRRGSNSFTPIKFFACQKNDDVKKKKNFLDSDHVDLSELGPVRQDWFSQLTNKRLRSVKYDESAETEDKTRTVTSCAVKPLGEPEDALANVSSLSASWNEDGSVDNGREHLDDRRPTDDDEPVDEDVFFCEAKPLDEREKMDEYGRDSQLESQDNLMSDNWDSPRLPYTWTPGSSVTHSPTEIKLEPHGSKQSSSPSTLAASLGVNLEGSVFSWTSSLETPPCQTPATDLQASGDESLSVSVSCSSSLSQPKRLPRALFSPSKATDSVIFEAGLNVTDNEDDDDKILDETLLSSSLPFASSPWYARPSQAFGKLEGSKKSHNLMSTPCTSIDSPMFSSPGCSVIESTLSDFFHTPMNSAKCRRKQAPGKSRAGNEVRVQASPVSSGPNTPLNSPLHSILSSEKKSRTPASLKRVRFADEIRVSLNTEVLKTSGLGLPDLELDSVNTCDNETNDKSTKPKHGEVPGVSEASRQDDVMSVSEAFQHGSLVKIQNDTKENPAGAKNKASAISSVKTVFHSTTGIVSEPQGHVTEALGVCSPPCFQKLEPCRTGSGHPTVALSSASERISSGHGSFVTCKLASETITASDDRTPRGRVTEQVTDDMFSQVSPDMLDNMCLALPELPNTVNVSTCSIQTSKWSRVSSTSESCEETTETHESPRKPGTLSEVQSPRNQVDSTKNSNTGVGLTSPGVRNKDEDLFTQISPGFMDSIIDVTKTAEDIPVADSYTKSEPLPREKTDLLSNPPQNVISTNLSSQLQDRAQWTTSTETFSKEMCMYKDSKSSDSRKSRKTKTKSFLYPSVQQINLTCPKKVFDFKPGKQEVDVSGVHVVTSVLQTEKSPGTPGDSLDKLCPDELCSHPVLQSPSSKTCRAQLFSENPDFTETRREKRQITSNTSEFKSFSELMKDCDLGLLDSSFEDPGESAEPSDKSVVPCGASAKSSGKSVVPCGASAESSGKSVVPCGASAKSSGKSVVPRDASAESSGKIVVPSGASAKLIGKSVVSCGASPESSGKSVVPCGSSAKLSGKRVVPCCASANPSGKSVVPCGEVKVMTSNESALPHGLVQPSRTNFSSLTESANPEKADKEVRTAEEDLTKTSTLCTSVIKKEDMSSPMILQSPNSQKFVRMTSNEDNVRHCPYETEVTSCGILQVEMGSAPGIGTLLECHGDECKSTRGFQTASGRGIQLSESNLRRAQALIAESLLSEGVKPQTSSSNVPSANLGQKLNCESLNNGEKVTESGFTTASGKNKKIGSKSILKASLCIEEINNDVLSEDLPNDNEPDFKIWEQKSSKDDSPSMHSNTVKTADINKIERPSDFSGTFLYANGFETAGGKKLTVSKENLDNARVFMEESIDEVKHQKYGQTYVSSKICSPSSVRGSDNVEESLQQREESVPSKPLGLLSNGFMTAAGRDVKIREESMDKARALVEESHYENMEVPVASIGSVSDSPCSDRLMNDQGDHPPDGQNSASVALNGFTTAGGKSFTLSKSSLERARALIDENDDLLCSAKASLFETKDSDMRKVRDDLSHEAHSGSFGMGDSRINLFVRNKKQSEDSIMVSGRMDTEASFKTSRVPCTNNPQGSSKSRLTNPNVPKGFRPFKPPRIASKTESKMSTQAADINVERSFRVQTSTNKLARSDLEHSAGKKVLTAAEIARDKHIHEKSFDDSLADEDLCAHLTSIADETCNTSSLNQKMIETRENYLSTHHKGNSPKDMLDHKSLDAIFAGNMAEEAESKPSPKIAGHKEKPILTSGISALHPPVSSTSFECDLDDSVLEAVMVDMTTAASMVTTPHNISTACGLKRSRPASFSDDESFQSDLERLPKEMKITIMPTVPDADRFVVPDTAAVSSKNPMFLPQDTGITGIETTEIPCLQTTSDDQNTIHSFIQTASGQPENLETDLNLVRQLFDEEDNFIREAPKVVQVGTRSKQTIGISASNSLFQTASGRSVNISEQSLKAAKAQLSEGDYSNQIHNSTIGSSITMTTKGSDVLPLSNSLFQTASGNSLQISEHSKKAAKAQLEVGQNDDSSQTDFFSVPALASRSDFFPSNNLFQTASGKSVNISEQSLKAAKAHLSEQDEESGKTKVSARQSPANMNPKETGLTTSLNLFQTASGKSVNISEQSLKAAKAHLYEQDEESGKTKVSARQSSANMNLKETGLTESFNLFQTASGKSVNISEQSLKAAKVHLSEQDEESGKTKVSARQSSASMKLKETGLTESLNLFQTASGKSVNISEQSLKAAKAHLSEQDEESGKTKVSARQSPGNMNLKETGLTESLNLFRTASGKSVNISEQSLKAATAHLSEQDEESGKTKVSARQSPANMNLKETGLTESFNLFQTASGKSVNISEQSLKAAKAHLSEQDEESGKTKVSARQSPANMNQKETGLTDDSNLFRTASGKSVNISEQSLKAATAHLSEQDEESGKTKVSARQSPANMNLKETGLTESFNLFQTASGKSVNISEQSLKAAKAHLSEQDEESGKTKVSARQSPANMNQKETGLTDDSNLFQTASGKSVNISEQSLKAAKAHLSEQDEEPGKTKVSARQSSTNLNPKETGLTESFNLFQTASGKSVNISEQSLKAAKAHLSEQDQESCKTTVSAKQSPANMDLKETGLTMSLNLFQTASGKSVNISEQSLKTAKAQLSEGENIEFNETENPTSHQLSKAASLFQTASGSNVTISNQALEEARQQLDHSKTKVGHEVISAAYTGVEPSSMEVGEQNVGSFGSVFQTCSGKAVNISQKALLHARESYANADERLRKSKSVVYKASMCGIEARPAPENAKPDKIVGKEEDVEQNQQTTCKQSIGKRIVHRETVYKRNPKYSTPEASLRDHPYRRRRTFIPQQCLEQNPNSCDRPTDSVSPLCVTQSTTSNLSVPSSSFKTPYKTGDVTNKPAVVDGCAKRSSSYKMCSETTDSEPSFNPFLSGHGSLKSTGDSHKHIPTCSGDNVAVQRPSCNKTQTPRNSVSDELVDCGENIQKNEERKAVQMSRLTLSEETVTVLQMAKLQQDKLISRQKRKTVRPSAGKLMVLKRSVSTEHRFKLKNCAEISIHHGSWTRKLPKIPISVFKVTSRTAEDYRFDLTCHYGTELLKQGSGVIVGDGIRLLPAEDCTAGKSEFFRAFITHENVDPKLISEDWFYNHYRWVVWKLAAYEVYFPVLWAGRCLTPDTVMLQLKYRYDREIDSCQRPALRKILEHDDTPGKRLVLCISDVITCESGAASVPQEADKPTVRPSQVEVEVTDGWYCVRASIDTPLQELIKIGKLVCGDKVCVCGAELTGSEEPANPLQAPGSARLKLCANSTRKARWDSKLGYQPDPRPFSLPLSSLLAGGGSVPAVDVVVLRVYPKMFFEKLADGRTIFRNTRAEQKADTAYRRKSEHMMEQMYNKLQAELEVEEEKLSREESRGGKQKKRVKMSEVESLCTGQELYEAVNSSMEPHLIEMSLSSHQMALLHEHRQSLMEQKRQKLQADFQKALKEKQQSEPARTVTPLLKVRVAGCHLQDVDAKLNCLLTIWRPSDDVMNMLREGRKLCLYNLSVTAARSRLSSCPIQITATRSTRYQEKSVEENFLDQIYEPREVLMVNDMNSQSPAYGEVDFVGIVLKIDSPDLPSERGPHMVYVADTLGELAVIRVWGGLQSLDLEDVLATGKYFLGSNLLYRGKRWKQLITLDICPEITYFTQRPASKLYHNTLTQAQAKAKDKGFVRSACESLDTVLGTTAEQHHNESDALPTPVTPKPDLRNQSRLVVATSDTPDQSTVSDARKAILQSKCAKLARYSGAPPLSPLNTPISKTVRKAFRPPRRQSTPQ